MATTVTLKPNAIDISGSTSGTTTLQATAVAGTTTLTLPAATDTLVGKATTDTLTNKTLTGAVMNGTLGATTPSTVAATSITASTTLGVTGVATFSAGAVGTPSITTTGDTNTGIFFPAADTIAFSEGGAESMRIDSSGNVLVGTSGAIGKFGVVTPTTGYSLAMQGRTTDGQSIMSSMDRSGTVYTGNLTFPEDGSILFGRLNTGSQTERMRIDSSGNLRINNTNTSLWVGTEVLTSFGFSLFKNSGTPALVWNTDASGTLIAFSVANRTDVGSITSNGTTTAYNTTSDYRLKNTISPMTGALDKVALLKPVTYKWNIDGSSSQGFIAHELQEVVPDCVNGEKDAVETYTDEDGNEQTRPKYQGIDTSFLVATLTAAIQEQQALITALTARITALEQA